MPATIKTIDAGTAAHGAICNIDAYVAIEDLAYDTPVGTTVLIRDGGGVPSRQGVVKFSDNTLRSSRTGAIRWVVGVEIIWDREIYNGNNCDRGITIYHDVKPV